MKTDHNGHALRNLTHRVMAVIDDKRNTRAAVETLDRPVSQTGSSRRSKERKPLSSPVLRIVLGFPRVNRETL